MSESTAPPQIQQPQEPRQSIAHRVVRSGFELRMTEQSREFRLLSRAFDELATEIERQTDLLQQQTDHAAEMVRIHEANKAVIAQAGEIMESNARASEQYMALLCENFKGNRRQRIGSLVCGVLTILLLLVICIAETKSGPLFSRSAPPTQHTQQGSRQ